MKTTTVSFRFTWEDLDNLKYIQYYYADRHYSRTDVLRMLLRDRRNVLEAVSGSDSDSNLRDFLRGVEIENEQIADEFEDSEAINTEPSPRSGNPTATDATNAS